MSGSALGPPPGADPPRLSILEAGPDLAKQSERGAAMVEFALVLPILVLLVFGITEYGYRFMKQSQLNNFAYIAARHYSISDESPTEIEARIAAATPNGGTVPELALVTACPEDADGDDNAVVDIDVDWPSVTGLLNLLPGINDDGTVSYHAEGVARCDG